VRLSQNKFVLIAVYALCGFFCAIPFIFNELWFFGWIAYVPVLLNEWQRSEDWGNPYKRAWIRGLAFFYAYGLAIFYWLWELYPMNFIGFSPITSFFVIILAWLGLPLLQGVVSAFNIVILCFLKKRNAPAVLYVISAAFAWVIFEWIQTLTWAGIPWGKLAMGQTGAICLVQSASLFGSYFVSFLMICVAGCIAIALQYCGAKETRKISVIAIVCAITIFISNCTYGAIAMYEEREYRDTVKVGVVQGNVASVDKWKADMIGMLDLHKELIVAAKDEGADLIVLAETALPYKVNRNQEITEYLQAMIIGMDKDLIFGCLHRGENGQLYNAVRYLKSDGAFLDNIYYKRHLVPFGEYMPMGNVLRTLLPFLEDINLTSQELTPGSSSAIFDSKVGNIGSLICFDSIYEDLALQSVRDGAELLAISTNDSWFQDSAAVYQHKAHAQLRAIETGRYVVRAANSGISSIITDRGEVLCSIDPLVKGYAVDEVKLTDHMTLYANVGNIIVTVAFIWLLGMVCFLEIQKRRSSKLTPKKCAKKKKK
jgi:apolipoprotein N-acyltransferase